MPPSEPQAAYIHVPFCRHRCGYCNFTLVAGRDDLIESYLTAIETELSRLREPRPVSTLFFGGGTPTHLPPKWLQKLCELALRWFPLNVDYEFSIEANPLDLDETRCQILADAGVNRVSIGAQSFHDQKLCRLERDHRGADVIRSIDRAKQFANSVGIDLIFAAPDETLTDWQDDLAQAIAAGVDHISTYGLTIEKGTAFGSRALHGDLHEVNEQTQAEMYRTATERLPEAGLEHYEISNFARAGHRCCHNETYWRGDSYFAAGPGAASYQNGRRIMNHRSTTTYIRRVLAGESPVHEVEELADEDRAREQLVFQMRMIEGVCCQSFFQRTGWSVEELFGASLAHFIDRGLVEQAETHIRLTPAGILVSDSLLARTAVVTAVVLLSLAVVLTEVFT